MRIIAPIAITDSMVISSNIVEDDYSEFSMGTTYAPGDIVMDSTGLEILLLNVAPATEWAPGDLITGQTSGKTCRAVLKITSLAYYIRERTGAFILGEIIGVTGTPAKLADQGATYPVVTESTDKIHRIYEAIDNDGVEVMTLDVAPATPWIDGRTVTGQSSKVTCEVITRLTGITYLVRERSGDFTDGEVIGVTGVAAEQAAGYPSFSVATNEARYPAIDLLRSTPAFWKELTATGKWKPFDGKVGSQAARDGSITYSLKPGLIDSAAFNNMDATGISLTMTDPIEGIVYTKSVDLISKSGIVDAYTYCFNPIIKKSDHAEFNIPPYMAATMDITITYTGGTAKVGEIVLGMSRDLGATLYKPSAGINDFSQKSADDAGNYNIVQGVYSKTNEHQLKIPNISVDEVYRLLASYRATPLVWVGMEEYATWIAYGFFSSFKIELSDDFYSYCSLEIEGLT